MIGYEDLRQLEMKVQTQEEVTTMSAGTAAHKQEEVSREARTYVEPAVEMQRAEMTGAIRTLQ